MRKKHLIWIIPIFMLPLLACSLLDGITDTISSQTSLGSEDATITPVPTLAPVVEEVAEVEEPPPVPVEPAQPETTEFIGVTGLESLSSYKVTFIMDFDGLSGGEPSVGRIELALENTSEPPARYLGLTMAGTMLDDVGGYNSTKFDEVSDKIYLYNEAAGEGQWISMESGAPGSETFRQGFFAPDEDLEIPKTARCDIAPEIINNISATHCSFSGEDVETNEVSFESLSGDVWIAEEGNYIIKYVLNATGYQAQGEEAGLFDVGTVHFEYDLTDINANFTITPPNEAVNAESLDFGNLGDGGDEANETPDLPIIDGAEELFSMSGLITYYINSDVASVVEFYRQSLPAQGWAEDANNAFVDETTGLLSFTKDNQALTITLNTEPDGRVNVGLIVTGQ
jgi:hypothetical protein